MAREHKHERVHISRLAKSRDTRRSGAPTGAAARRGHASVRFKGTVPGTRRSPIDDAPAPLHRWRRLDLDPVARANADLDEDVAASILRIVRSSASTKQFAHALRVQGSRWRR